MPIAPRWARLGAASASPPTTRTAVAAASSLILVCMECSCLAGCDDPHMDGPRRVRMPLGGLLAAAGVLTIIPGAIVIWFVRNYIAKGFALGRV